MRFGVNILNFGAETDPDSLLSWAGFAEERGLHSAMISDHLAVTPDVAEHYPAPFYDPFTTLAWLAGRTERIELGTTVAVLPYRHPLHTARIAANIDRFSSGRLVLGVGVSWPRQEFAALGVPFHRRGAMADEYLDVIRRAWTEEKFSFEGEFVSFTDVATGPLPTRRPPIWVGGHSEAALRRAVRVGDAWHPVNQRMEWLRAEGVPALHRIAAEQHRPVPEFAPRIQLRTSESPLDEESRLAGQGTLDQIRRDLDGLAELGATHVLLDTYGGVPSEHRPVAEDLAVLDAVVEKVLPEHLD
ncbi:TIGR03619 family F420-dependent LLM class oxidoreductase [Actinopolyspora saharensis]|uniref:TIGR03619 family F420-dependent LLM class oxidoreductase n=1 Tax=Actinopolyspora saharensis TaxID=995062 RepID=UPI003F680677